MDDQRNAFLSELEEAIKNRKRLELGYRVLQVGLMVVIAACGFLTAAASQTETKTTLVSTPTSLLILGLLSAVCAIINQVLSPADKYSYHKNVKRALQYVRGAAKFKGIPVNDAEDLRQLAVVNPAVVLDKLSNA